jgi:hypothetical protein
VDDFHLLILGHLLFFNDPTGDSGLKCPNIYNPISKVLLWISIFTDSPSMLVNLKIYGIVNFSDVPETNWNLALNSSNPLWLLYA